MAKIPKQTFIPKKIFDGHVYEKVLNITNQQEIVYKNCNKISPHICHNDYHQRDEITIAGKDIEKSEHLCTNLEYKLVLPLW